MSFLRSSGLNAVIVIVLSLSWIIPAGASGVFVLKNIEVNSNDESKHVRLEFDGEFSAEFYEFVKKKFIKTKLTKPKASRKPSSELYCICMGFLNSEKSE